MVLRTARHPTEPLASAVFGRRLTLAIAIPIVMMALIATILVFLVLRLAGVGSAAADSERAIAEINYLERRLIDAETGMRGFLQFGEEEFLEPARLVETDVRQSAEELGREDLEPGQREHLDAAVRQYHAWASMSADAIAYRRAGNPEYRSLELARQRKVRMDAIRAALQAVRDREAERRAERSKAASRTTRLTLWVNIGLLMGVGIVMATLMRWELRRLSAGYEANLEGLQRKTAELQVLTATLEQRVEERTRQWQQANQELEAFTYSVSHDLRAPLRHISGFSGLLEGALQDHDDPQVRHYLTRIVRRTHDAGQLIDDLLSFSRTGRVALVTSSIDTNAIVRSVADSVASEHPERAVEWSIGDLPRVDADPALLQIVFTNLLSNAFKYTRPRELARIGVHAGREGDRVIVDVSDNGVGFDMQYADKLFGVFQRLHGADEFEGTGIGLATVRRIVARHGGETWARGAVDEGATFSFSIPATRAHEAA